MPSVKRGNKKQRLRLAAGKEAEAERKEAEKKKPKPADFDESRAIGDRIAILPSPFAIKKLDEFSYIELFYFSPEGCAGAADQQRSVAEDGFVLARTDNALALRPISLFKASRNVIKDVDLTWRQMEMGAKWSPRTDAALRLGGQTHQICRDFLLLARSAPLPQFRAWRSHPYHLSSSWPSLMA
jgi:hypothetical protein